MRWPGLIKHYKAYLPVTEETPVVTLHEGNTLLLKADNIVKEWGFPIELYLKFEGQNPTGSFKDRGMTLAVSKAKEEGASGIICASTGNTSASAAAYGARAGLPCFVLVPDKAIALGKMAQALAYGAKVVAIKGNFDDALRFVRELSDKHQITLVNSVNPYRLAGQQTGAMEVCDQLGSAPDFLAIPVGNAGNISAYWQGFQTYHEHDKIASLPTMLGFQAAGAAPLVSGRPVSDPETLATAIRIGNPASWDLAINARNRSGGLIDQVTDTEILAAYHLLARREGIFAEPASAASVAGVYNLVKAGYFAEGARVVCVLTGNGLKDPDIAVQQSPVPQVVPADMTEIEQVLLG